MKVSQLFNFIYLYTLLHYIYLYICFTHFVTILYKKVHASNVLLYLLLFSHIVHAQARKRTLLFYSTLYGYFATAAKKID